MTSGFESHYLHIKLNLHSDHVVVLEKCLYHYYQKSDSNFFLNNNYEKKNNCVVEPCTSDQISQIDFYFSFEYVGSCFFEQI
jgi:hypothetical protein